MPGLGVWVAAALFMALALVGVPWALGEDRPWFPRADEWLSVAGASRDGRAMAAAKAYSGQAASADILIFGDSTMMAAFWDDRPLSEALGRQGIPAAVASLTSGAQLPSEALFLASHMPLRADQTVIVSYRYSALRRAESSAFLDRGAYLRDPASAATRWHRDHVNERGLPGYLATQLGLARERLGHQVLQPLQRWAGVHLYRRPSAAYDPHATFPDSPPSPDLIRDQWHRSDQLLDEHFDEAIVQARDALDELFDRLRSSGCRVIVLEPPRAGDVFSVRHAVHKQRFETLIGNLTGRHAVERVDLNPSIVWEPSDLADLVHLSRRGRDKWSAAFVAWAREDALRRPRDAGS